MGDSTLGVMFGLSLNHMNHPPSLACPAMIAELKVVLSECYKKCLEYLV